MSGRKASCACLIWTSTWAPGPGQPLPVAMLPAGCMFRDRALALLGHAGVAHELVYTSASLLGVIAAAQAGLGVTVLGQGSLPAGLREVGWLPPLGTAEVAVFGDAESRGALAGPLIGVIRESLAERGALRSAA